MQDSEVWFCLTWSLSSVCPRSLPLAWAILFPDTRFPTITEAGPISAARRHKPDEHCWHFWCTNHIHCPSLSPGCFCRGLGRLVTHVWGHIRTLQGCSPPSRYSCLISERWIPPRGVLGRVLAGTRARQKIPTPWILSMAWEGDREADCWLLIQISCKHFRGKTRIYDLNSARYNLHIFTFWSSWS